MQRGEARVDVDVRDDGGALPVRPAGHLGIPAGLDQAQERIDGVGKRRRLIDTRPPSASPVSWSRFQSATSASR